MSTTLKVITAATAVTIINQVLDQLYTPDRDECHEWSGADDLAAIAAILDEHAINPRNLVSLTEFQMKLGEPVEAEVEVGDEVDFTWLKTRFYVQSMEEWTGEDIACAFNQSCEMQIEYVDDSVWRITELGERGYPPVQDAVPETDEVG